MMGLSACENSAMTCRHAPQGLQSFGAGRHDRDGRDVNAPVADGVKEGDALGTHGQSERGVFHVTAPVDRAVGEQHRRAHCEIGVGSVSGRLRLPRGGQQFPAQGVQPARGG